MTYRKRPVIIEAVTWYGKYTDGTEWPDWFREAVDSGMITQHPSGALNIHTLEGVMRAEIRDYVIKGIKGELYPCKPDIFEASYERVTPNVHTTFNCPACGTVKCEK